jgi:hypothetical protein
MPSAATLALFVALAGAWAHAALAEDRYGPSAPIAAAAPTAQNMASFSLLSWPSKGPAPRPAPPAPVVAPPAPAEALYRAARVEPIQASRLPASIYAPPYPSMTPYRSASSAAPVDAAPSAPPAPPSRSYASAAPTPAAADGARSSQPPHFYSLHREFGLTPDPIPLPQQFFADSAAGADMAAPPPPLPPHPVPGTQAATSTANTPANRTRALEYAGDDASAN